MSATFSANAGDPKRLLDAGRLEMANRSLMTREQAQAIIEKVRKASKADEVSINLGSRHSADVRFAANQLSTSGGMWNTELTVTSSFGKRHGAASTNDLSDESIKRVVGKSESLAKLSPEDPESMPALGPQTYLPVNAYVERTAMLTPADRAHAALTALEPARKAGDLQAAGFLVVDASSRAVGNARGLFGYHRSTVANYTLTVRTADGTGSGWAGAEGNDWKVIDFAKLGETAIEKARRSRNPVAIEPGRYTVILEPQAVADLVQPMASALGARTADEGRSAFSKPGGGNRIGERIVDPRITLISDPQDPQLLAAPFDDEGMPGTRATWIENGVLRQLIYSRYWAQKQGKQPNTAPSSLKLVGGTTSTEEMIRSTARGVLVTRLFYLRQVDPRTILYTGLTRDGTFLIEDGKITRAIKNFRFNESPLSMLNNLEALGPAVRVAGTESGGVVVMPTVKVRNFNFTSLSDAV
ncbi:MAG: TldD/PmbA family protein [Gemmatimonadaceae bacterium]